MKLIGYTVRLIGRRPPALAFLSAAVLLFCIIDSFNPIMPILLGLGAVTSGSIFENAVSFLQLIVDPEVIATLILVLACLSAAGAAAAGAVSSGLFYSIYNALEGRKRTAGELLEGIRKNFVKLSLISLRVITAGVVTGIILLVASVPAMIVVNSAKSGKAELILAAIFISILTSAVVFFGLMFFRTYMFFWYPAFFFEENRPFASARKVVDNHFWSITGKFLTFDIFFVLFQLALSAIKNAALLFVAKWLFGTMFLMLFITYLFTAYKRYGTVSKGSKA